MYMHHGSNSQCGSFDGDSGSVFGGCGAGGSYGDCAGSSTGQNVQATAVDDLLPPGRQIKAVAMTQTRRGCKESWSA
jgi:hypothetical protein